MALVLVGICVHVGSDENVGGPAMLFRVVISLAFMAGVLVLRSKALTMSLNSEGDRLSR